jgi:hypothetical protein
MPVVAGTYDLEYSAAGFITQTKTGQTVVTGRTKTVVVVLNRTGGFQGIVKHGGQTTPLEDVLVEVLKGGVPQTNMTTGADGAFRFEGLVPGPYVLRFTAAGFKPKSMPRAVPDGTVVTVNVSLAPGACDNCHIPRRSERTPSPMPQPGPKLAGSH